MNISTVYPVTGHLVCFQDFVFALFYFALIKRAVFILCLLLGLCMHYISDSLGIHHHRVTWLTWATFTSRITMLFCFMFQVEDRASFMISTLSCHFPASLMLMWKMPLSPMRTSIPSLEGEEIQDEFSYFLTWDLDNYIELVCFFLHLLSKDCLSWHHHWVDIWEWCATQKIQNVLKFVHRIKGWQSFKNVCDKISNIFLVIWGISLVLLFLRGW